jgi:hypothetical protein
MNRRVLLLLLGSLLASGSTAALAEATVGTAPAPALAPATPTPDLAPLASLFTGSPAVAPRPAPPDAVLASASPEVQRTARWIAESRDNADLPYLLVDKVNAQVFVFGPDGRLRAEAPALLGMTPGDKLKVSNDTQMAQMTAQDRVTPAGRFLSRLAIDSHGNELLVIDYDAAISLHPVVKGTPEEHRAERLASATSADNRISYGCINVPPAFYSGIVSPAFTHRKGLVYILPEQGSAGELFGFQPAVDAPAPAATTATNPPAADAPPISTALDPPKVEDARPVATAMNSPAGAAQPVSTPLLLSLPVPGGQASATSALAAPTAVAAPDLK